MLDYMVYYSKNKINMLYEQIESRTMPTDFKSKIGVNFGVVSGEISSNEQHKNNDMGKLNIVLDHLEAEKLIGSIHEYKDYIRGPLLMGWETFDITHWGTKISFSVEDHLYIVTLFGSKENIIGTANKGEFSSYSIYPFYVDFAKKHFDSESVEEPFVWQLMEGINIGYTGEFLPYDFVAKVLYRETLSLDYRVENNNLVATLDPFNKTTYILATPLYVSLPQKVSERIRRIDGKNYVAVDDFSKELKNNKGLLKTTKKLSVILERAALLEESVAFKTEVERYGDNITEFDFMQIAKKYFIIENHLL